jgi:hypothetical protein
MDIQVIIVHFPSCQTWKDVANLCRINLNPRTIEGTTTPPHTRTIFHDVKTFKNAVLADEIVAFFKLNGLSEEEAQKATLALIDLGHFKLIGWTFDRKHAIIDIGEIQR